METKTYLMKHAYNYDTKSITNISGSTITVQFKVMDTLTVLEIVGILRGQSNEEFKHQIICHKDQDLTILPSVNDQIEQVDNLESVYQDRVSVDRGSDIVGSHDLMDFPTKQVDLEDLIREQN